MNSDSQILEATQKIVENLLGLRWKRAEKLSNPSVFAIFGDPPDDKQLFEFFGADGSIVAKIEFCSREFYEGEFLVSIHSLSGKIYDPAGNTLVSVLGDLCDVRGRLTDHPMVELYKVVWNKESGEPGHRRG